MKILNISTSDIKGGAARVAYRLYKGLNALGIESHMLVQQRFSSEPEVIGPSNKVHEGMAIMRQSFDKMPLKFYKKRQKTSFSPQWLPNRILPYVEQFNPDIIHLHWINQDFVQIETLKKLDRPIVYTFHDILLFIGGYHYVGDYLS